MDLDAVKVKTKYHTSTTILRLTAGNKQVFLGKTGFGIAIDPYDVESLPQVGYVHINNQVVSLPAIPVVCKERLLVVSTAITSVGVSSASALVTPEATHILNNKLSNSIKIPAITNVDMSKCMVPVLTDDHGKSYMSTPSHKVLYVNDALEAQATIMQVTIPLSEELLDLGRQFVRAVLSPDTENPEDYYIYLKDRFINVF